MRRFLIQIFGFALLQAVLVGLLMMRYTVSDSDNYLAETAAKNRLLRQTGSGKLVLLGGSSAAFGFHSDRMERALSRPVINQGLAAGLGVEYMLAEVRPALRSGDLIVLSFEYDHFARGPRDRLAGELGFDPAILHQVLVFRPAGLWYLGATHVRRLLLDRGLVLAGDIARRGLRSWFTALHNVAQVDPSSRRGFNRWGDFVAHRPAEQTASPNPISEGRLVGDLRNFPSPALCQKLAEFVKAMKARGVGVAWTFPPRPEEVLRREGEAARLLETELRRIPGLMVLDSPVDHAYAAGLFHDSANHLTGAGALIRTDRVIAALQKLQPLTGSLIDDDSQAKGHSAP